MAAETDSPPRGLTRKQLAEFLPSHEAIKAFESVQKLATQTTPENVEQNSADIAAIQENLLALVAAVSAGASETALAALAAAEAQVAMLSGQLAETRDRLAVFERAINDLQQGVQL
jgi:hypothetical protein